MNKRNVKGSIMPTRIAAFISLVFVIAATVGWSPGAAIAGENGTVRLAVLNFGTVNWELNVIKHHGLDTKAGVTLEVVPLANKHATSIALNAGDADMIVTDWIWVSRQRAAGADYTFLPYSEAAGSVMVDNDSGINSIADLADKVVGIAGGNNDKSWLLLRAYSMKTLGEDIGKKARPAFAAPPLLNAKFNEGELDAVLNYWNYTAKLRAENKKEIVKVQDLLPALGVPGRLPLIGYVFSEAWAAENQAALASFIEASTTAREILMTSDDEWNRIRDMTKAKDDEELIALRDGYRDGVPEALGPQQEEAIRAAFKIVAELGGRTLVGPSNDLAPGTVWGGAH